MFCTSEENPKAQKKVYECKILIRKPLATSKRKKNRIEKMIPQGNYIMKNTR
jgi:hypothetical protein